MSNFIDNLKESVNDTYFPVSCSCHVRFASSWATWFGSSMTASISPSIRERGRCWPCALAARLSFLANRRRLGTSRNHRIRCRPVGQTPVSKVKVADLACTRRSSDCSTSGLLSAFSCAFSPFLNYCFRWRHRPSSFPCLRGACWLRGLLPGCSLLWALALCR